MMFGDVIVFVKLWSLCILAFTFSFVGLEWIGAVRTASRTSWPAAPHGQAHQVEVQLTRTRTRTLTLTRCARPRASSIARSTTRATGAPAPRSASTSCRCFYPSLRLLLPLPGRCVSPSPPSFALQAATFGAYTHDSPSFLGFHDEQKPYFAAFWAAIGDFSLDECGRITVKVAVLAAPYLATTGSSGCI